MVGSVVQLLNANIINFTVTTDTQARIFTDLPPANYNQNFQSLGLRSDLSEILNDSIFQVLIHKQF